MSQARRVWCPKGEADSNLQKTKRNFVSKWRDVGFFSMS